MAIPTLITPASGHALTGTEWDDLYSAVRYPLPRVGLATGPQSAATAAWRNHPELFVQVEAHTVWDFTFKCFYTAGSTDDMWCRFNFPTGVVGDLSSLGVSVTGLVASAGGPASGDVDSYGPSATGPLAATLGVGGTSSGVTPQFATYSGVLRIGSAGGLVQVQFAKITNSSAEVATIVAPSALILRRID